MNLKSEFVCVKETKVTAYDKSQNLFDTNLSQDDVILCKEGEPMLNIDQSIDERDLQTPDVNLPATISNQVRKFVYSFIVYNLNISLYSSY